MKLLRMEDMLIDFRLPLAFSPSSGIISGKASGARDLLLVLRLPAGGDSSSGTMPGYGRRPAAG